MLLHIIKMIWNRKRSNSLIIAEVAIAFMVVFFLAVIAIRNYTLYQIPLGYDYQNMWQVRLFTGGRWNSESDQETLKQLTTGLDQFAEVQSVNLMRTPTFEDWSWTSSSEINGIEQIYNANSIDDGAAENLNMTLLEGRWFGPQDSGQNYTPVIINRRFADQVFPDQSPIGQNIAESNSRERRIVGVFEDFRQFGELHRLTNYVFTRYDINTPNELNINHIQLKLLPGTTAVFEEALSKRLKGIAPNWEFNIESWDSKRKSHLRETLLPMMILGVIGSFLILMVAMGLFGVLWQNVTGRTQEIGLRRALGATANSIHWQIIAELLVVTLLGIAGAVVLLIQLPILGLFSELNWSLFWPALSVATVFMLLLSATCAFYPGKIATAYVPAEALHYE